MLIGLSPLLGLVGRFRFGASRSQPNAAQSSLVFDAGVVDADGATGLPYTLAVRDASGRPVVGAAGFGVRAKSVWSLTDMQADSLVSASPPSIEDNDTAEATITVRLVVDVGGGVLVPVPDVAVTLSSDGTGNTIVQPAAVTDANGITSGTIKSSVAETKTITATALGLALTQTVEVTVTSGAPPAEENIVFASHFATGTGTGNDEILDTGNALPWSMETTSGADELSVVAATGLGFPAGMDNVLRVPQTGHSFHVGIQNGWAMPGTDGSIGFQWYVRCAISDDAGDVEASNWHSPQANLPAWNGGSILWAFEPIVTGSGGFRNRWNLNSVEGDWRLPLAKVLAKNHTYRMRFLWTRIGSSDLFRFRFECYNESNVRVLTEADYTDGGGTPLDWTAVECFADGGGSADMLRGLLMGSNGGPDLTGDGYMYYSGIKVVAGAFPQPFFVGEGPP